MLRSTVLTDKNQIQWNKLMKLVDEMSSAAQSAVDEAVATTTEALSEATEAAMGTMGMKLEGTRDSPYRRTNPLLLLKLLQRPAV